VCYLVRFAVQFGVRQTLTPYNHSYRTWRGFYARFE
jgi:hypothetical protein